jgi:hypothetical protein
MTRPHPRHRTLAGLRRLIHLLLVPLGWIGFAWMWVLVAAQPWESQRLVWLIVGSLVILPVLTFAWILHNRSIHRRKGERRAVATADMTYTHDWHGRSVHAEWALLQRCRFVVISVDGAHKQYRGASPAMDTIAAARAETRYPDTRPAVLGAPQH